MRASRFCRAICVVVLIVFASTALAGDGGWSFPNLNPFSSSKSAKRKSTRASVSDKQSGWHLPSMKMPSLSKSGSGTAAKHKKPRSSEPSMASKMTEGTKSMVSKSVDALTFWDNDSKNHSKSTRKRSTAHTARKDSSWFNFSHEEEKKPTSVNDFLVAPRPQPE